MLRKIMLYTTVTAAVLGAGMSIQANESSDTYGAYVQGVQNTVVPVTRGVVTEGRTNIEENTIHVVGQGLNENSLDEIVLDISQANIYDMVTGKAATREDIQKGAEVIVYYSNAIGMSYPAIGNATHVFINVEKEQSANLKMQLGEKIDANNKNEVSFMSADGTYIMSFNENTEIRHENGEVGTIANLNKGDEVLVWFPLMTASMPGMATATKAVILSQDIEQVVPETNNNYTASQNVLFTSILGTVSEFGPKETGVRYILTDTEQPVYNGMPTGTLVPTNRVIDMVTGEVVGKDAIKYGQKVLVHSTGTSTKAIPPRLLEATVFVNVTDENAASMAVTLANSVESLNENEVTFMSQDGSHVVTFNEYTEVVDENGNQTTIQSLSTGAEVILWVPFIAQSYPAQSTATKAVILSPQQGVNNNTNAYANYTDSTWCGSQMEVYIMAIEDRGLIYTTDAGVKLVPVREAAELNGFTVNFNNETRKIEISKGDILIAYKNGDLTYTVNGQTKYFQYEDTTRLIGEKSYITWEFLLSTISV
jgi:hypothetical protein